MILEKKILPGNIQPSSSPKNKREKQKVRHKQTPNKDRTIYPPQEILHVNRETLDLNNVINQVDLANNYRAFHPNSKEYTILKTL